MATQGQGADADFVAVPRTAGDRLQALRLGRRAKRGERSAFAEIFRTHHQGLYRYCLAILRDRDDAEDALQATMAAALRSLPGESRRIEVRPWLFRVAHNESISILRRRRDEAGEDELADRAALPHDAEIATRERLRSLVADLGELPERQRSAIVMRELSGLSYGEIAMALSCTEGGARQAVYEARTALRDREEGREMECEQVRLVLSDRDGRRLRSRRLRAHLKGCDGCRGFAASISRRRVDLDALFPPLPAAAAGAMLSGLIGGGAGGAAAGGTAAGGTAAAAAGSGLAASAAVKGASLAAAVALAAGAADVGGLIDLPSPGGGGADGARSAPAGSSAPASNQRPASDLDRTVTGGGGSDARRGDGSGRDGSGPGNGDGRAGGGRQADGDGTGNGSPAGGSGSGDPGNSGTAPGNQASPGSSGTAPGQTGTSPGGGTGTAPGQTGTMPGNASDAPGNPGGASGQAGNSASAPGQTGTTPSADGTAGANGSRANAGPKVDRSPAGSSRSSDPTR